ncbi:uncharacterized protein LOC116170363 [Photinus pyralis]|uniref:uncharacterized protein LOC116170363 n=1 Tax=Photinus pyralis TaxID=7054 RepID=UPI0012676FA7|nr:uncharacterized protein LOC116170363 [Photinus pyralis]
MFLTYFIAIFAFASVNAVAPRVFTRMLENKIVDNISNVLLDLEKFDPYTIPTLNFPVNDGSVMAKDVEVHGLSKITVKGLKLTVIPPVVAIAVAFENITVSIGEYSVNITTDFAPVYGLGKLTLTSQNILLSCSGAARFDPLGVTDLKIRFDLDTFDFNVTGLLNNEEFSEIISSVISDTVPGHLQKHGAMIGQMVAKPVEEIINGLIPN